MFTPYGPLLKRHLIKRIVTTSVLLVIHAPETPQNQERLSKGRNGYLCFRDITETRALLCFRVLFYVSLHKCVIPPLLSGFIWDRISNFSIGSVYLNTFLELGKNKRNYFLPVMETPFIPFLLGCNLLASTIMPQHISENIALDKVDADEAYSIITGN